MFLAVFVAVVTGLVIGAFVTFSGSSLSPLPQGEQKKETAFERVVRTGVLRCGYNFWEPGLLRDEQKGTLWGFYYDVMAEFEKESGITVRWDHVVDWGNVRTELETGRIDAMCAMWNTSAESRYFLFTRPFSYQTVEMIARADDERFDADIMKANASDIRIAVIDNATQDFVAQSDFPHAQRSALQLFSSNAELLMHVETGKSDITFTNPGIFSGYDKSNPGKLKRVSPGSNLRVYGNSLAVRLDEKDLANLLNVSFGHLINTGKIDGLIRKYNDGYPGTFLRPEKDMVVN